MFEHNCPTPPRDQWSKWELIYDLDNNEWDLVVEAETLSDITFCPFCGIKLPKKFNFMGMEIGVK